MVTNIEGENKKGKSSTKILVALIATAPIIFWIVGLLH